MNNHLKLSYEMIFANGPSYDQTKTLAPEQPDDISPEKMELLLQQRDEEWQQKLENERNKAEKNGFELGFNEGKKQAETALNEQLSFIREMTQTLNREFNQSLEELHPHIAELVFDITEKVLDVPLEHPKLQQRVQDEVSKIIEQLDEDVSIRVTLSAADFEVVQQALGQKSTEDQISFRVDASHNPGEYAVETKRETIIKNFKKMVADFKESISFAEVDSLKLQA